MTLCVHLLTMRNIGQCREWRENGRSCTQFVVWHTRIEEHHVLMRTICYGRGRQRGQGRSVKNYGTQKAGLVADTTQCRWSQSGHGGGRATAAVVMVSALS